MRKPRPAGALGPIAIISHVHPSVSKGGAENSAYALFKGLQQLGEEVIFIAGCALQDRRRLHLDGDREFAVYHDVSSYDHTYHVAMPAVIEGLRTILLEERIRVANFHHFLFLGLDTLDMASAELGIQTIVTLHEFLAICHHHGQMVTRPARILCERDSLIGCGDCFPEMRHMQFQLRRQRFQRILGQLSGWVSPSRFLADRFIDWGLDAERLAVIENGLLNFDGVPHAPREHGTVERWSFGYFGQINQFKGVDVLLRACELIAADPVLARQIQIEVNGNIVGVTDSFRENFEKAVETHSFLTYRGAYNNASVSRMMRATDYVLMLSTWWENSPLVIQEAFESGRPVVCPGMGGMAEKVRDGVSGLHFQPADANDLVRAIRRAIEPDTHAQLLRGLPRPSQARDMAQNYRDAFQRFAVPQAAPKAERPVSGRRGKTLSDAGRQTD